MTKRKQLSVVFATVDAQSKERKKRVYGATRRDYATAA